MSDTLNPSAHTHPTGLDPAAEVAKAEDRLAASRAALLAKIDERDRLSRASGPRPTIASLLGDARRGAGAVMASTRSTPSAASPSSDPDSMTQRMSESAHAAPAPSVSSRHVPHAAVSEMGLAQAARSMLGHLPIPPLVPILESALDAGESWWRRQPWYDASDLFIREAESAIGPTIRRNPWLSVSTAAAVGAAVVMAKPWRWKTLETSLRPVPDQAKTWLKEQFQRSSVQSLAVAWVLGMVAKAGQSVASAGSSSVAAGMSRSAPPVPSSAQGPATARPDVPQPSAHEVG